MPILAPPTVDQTGQIIPGVQTLALGTIPLTTTEQTIDLTSPFMKGQLAALQSIYINNWSNDAVILAKAPATDETIIAPPFSVGWYPLSVPPIPRISMVMVPARSGITTVSPNVTVSSALIVQGPFFNDGKEDNNAPAPTAFPITAGGSPYQIPGVANQVIRVFGCALSLTAAGGITFTGYSGNIQMPATTPFILPQSERPYFESAVGGSFDIVTTANARGFILYTQGA